MPIFLRQRPRITRGVVSTAVATGLASPLVQHGALALNNADGVGVGVGAMILGALGLGLGLVLVGVIRRSHGQTDR
jgi:hypothetical protein